MPETIIVIESVKLDQVNFCAPLLATVPNNPLETVPRKDRQSSA